MTVVTGIGFVWGSVIAECASGEDSQRNSMIATTEISTTRIPPTEVSEYECKPHFFALRSLFYASNGIQDRIGGDVA